MPRFRLLAVVMVLAGTGTSAHDAQPRWAEISGVITTAEGVAVPGVQVVAARWVPPRGEIATRQTLPVGASAVTDMQGRYRIRGVLPGPVLIATLAWKRPFPGADDASVPSGYETTFFPGVTDPTLARTIDAKDEPIADLNFIVRPAVAATVVIRFAPVVMNSSGAAVILTPASIPARLGNRNVATAAARNGIHTFPGVPLGRYILTYQGETGWARQALDVTAPAKPLEVQVPLRPYFSLSGQVELHASHINLTDATRPALLSQMSVLLNASEFVGGQVNTASVDKDGRFVFPRLAGDSYMLLLAPDGNWRTVSGLINGRESLENGVALAYDVRDARVIVSDRDTSIYGLVRDAEGNVLTTGWVVVFSVDEAHWDDTSSRRVRSIPVGPTGQYATLGMAPGRYLAVYLAQGEAFSVDRLKTVKQTGSPIELAIGQRQILDVIAGR